MVAPDVDAVVRGEHFQHVDALRIRAVRAVGIDHRDRRAAPPERAHALGAEERRLGRQDEVGPVPASQRDDLARHQGPQGPAQQPAQRSRVPEQAAARVAPLHVVALPRASRASATRARSSRPERPARTPRSRARPDLARSRRHPPALGFAIRRGATIDPVATACRATSHDSRCRNSASAARAHRAAARGVRHQLTGAGPRTRWAHPPPPPRRRSRASPRCPWRSSPRPCPDSTPRRSSGACRRPPGAAPPRRAASRSSGASSATWPITSTPGVAAASGARSCRHSTTHQPQRGGRHTAADLGPHRAQQPLRPARVGTVAEVGDEQRACRRCPGSAPSPRGARPSHSARPADGLPAPARRAGWRPPRSPPRPRRPAAESAPRRGARRAGWPTGPGARRRERSSGARRRGERRSRGSPRRCVLATRCRSRGISWMKMERMSATSEELRRLAPVRRSLSASVPGSHQPNGCRPAPSTYPALRITRAASGSRPARLRVSVR